MPDIPASGEISLYDFYRDAPAILGDFPVASPDLVWVIDPISLDSSINSTINNNSVGFANASFHGLDTPLDTGGWATYSQAGASWNPGTGLVPPYIYLSESSHWFGPINSVFPQNWNNGFTFWMIFHSEASQGGSWKRIFHYGGQDALNDEAPGYGSSTSEYSMLSQFLYGPNYYYYLWYGVGGYYNINVATGNQGMMFLVVSRQPQTSGGDSYWSFDGTSVGNYGTSYPATSPKSNTPTWTLNSTTFAPRVSGTARPTFGYTGYGNINTTYTYHIRWYANGMASRYYDATERNALVTWLNLKYFGVSY